MRGDRSFRSRVEVWLYRRLRPLVAERQERLPLQIDGLAPLPEPTREPGGLARYKRLAAGAVLVAAAATGGTIIGYWWGHEAAERASPEPARPEPAVHAPKFIPGPPPEDAPWPPPERLERLERRELRAAGRELRAAGQPGLTQDVPASKSERQRSD